MAELIEVIRKSTGSQGPTGQAGAVGPMGPPGADGPEGEEGPQGPPAGPHNIDSHTDVDTTTIAPDIDEVLGWDGTNWTPRVPSSSVNISDEGTSVGVAPTLDFRGSGVRATVSVGVARIEIPGPVVFFPDEGEPGEPGPPGARGADGAAGSAGQAGAQGPMGPAVFLEAETGEDGLIGPPGVAGAAGSAGQTGAQGPTGPAVFLEAEPGDDGLIGPPGPTGTVADPVIGSYSPGSFVVATEKYAQMTNHLKLTGTQRVTVQGTGRLAIYN